MSAKKNKTPKPRVANTPSAPRRKRRTREHVISDLSVNHVERFIFNCTFASEVTRRDYGIDVFVSFYDAAGEIRNGQVLLQLKASDEVKFVKGKKFVSFPVEKKDLDFWLEVPQPVILVVYDALKETAYWMYVQAHFEGRTGFALSDKGVTITVNIPTANVVNEAAIRRFERFSDDVVGQQKGKIDHREVS